MSLDGLSEKGLKTTADDAVHVLDVRHHSERDFNFSGVDCATENAKLANNNETSVASLTRLVCRIFAAHRIAF
jgi:hypothetical protein